MWLLLSSGPEWPPLCSLCNNQCPAFLFPTMGLCVNHRKTDTVIRPRKYTGSTHFLFLCWAHWRQEVRGTTTLLFLLSDEWMLPDEKKLVLSQLLPTYTKDLGGWGGSRLLPLWKPITTNPIMSLECGVDAVNGLWCHFSKWPSYGSFTMAVDDHQLLSQQEKEGRPLLVCNYICVCVTVGFMHGNRGRVQAKTK